MKRGAPLALGLLLAVSVVAEEPKKPKEAKILATTSGLYLGRVVELDSKRRFIYVKPLKGNGARKTFYLDNLTIVRQERKPSDWKLVQPGRRVGIRYVREEDIAFAEGVFLIGEEINPREFEMPKRRPKKVVKEEEGGGHGTAEEKMQKQKAFSPAAQKKADAAAKAKGGGSGH